MNIGADRLKALLNKAERHYPLLHKAMAESDLTRAESLLDKVEEDHHTLITFTIDQKWYRHSSLELENVMNTWTKMSDQEPFSFYLGVLENLVPETAGKVWVMAILSLGESFNPVIPGVRGCDSWTRQSTRRVGQ